MTTAEHMPTVPTGALVAAAVLVGVSFGGGWWLKDATTPEDTTETDTVQVGRKGTEGDLPDATTPDVLTQYKVPDTIAQNCIQIPTWLAGRDSSRSLTQRGGQMRDTTKTLPRQDLQGRLPLSGLSYDIIPTTSGRPIVSVERHKVSTSTLDPETGAMSTWTWDIERPANRLSAFVEAGTLPRTAYALTGARYTRDLGRLEFWSLTIDTQIHGAAGQAWTTQGAGPAFQVGVSVGLEW